LFERLNFSITDNTIVIADVVDTLLGTLYLTVHGQTDFLSPAYYFSMGFAIPAAIEAQLARNSVYLLEQTNLCDFSLRLD
jgi:indolepyruvate decarboxylase